MTTVMQHVFYNGRISFMWPLPTHTSVCTCAYMYHETAVYSKYNVATPTELSFGIFGQFAAQFC